MTRLIALLCLVALAGPGGALAGERKVTIGSGLFFKPQVVNVLVGDTVLWTNKDSRAHDVRSDDGTSFASGRLSFNQPFVSPPFSATGDVPYHCGLHIIMRGKVQVHEVWLGGPSAPVPFPSPVILRGLAPEGTDVDVERFDAGSWTLVETVTSGAEDEFFLLVPTTPGQYRAVGPTATTQPVNVAVKPRVTLAKKRLPRKRTRVTATAAPNRAGAVAVLQRKKPAGWAVLASKRLSASSKAAFVVRPPQGKTWRVRVIVKKSGGYAAGQSGAVAVKR